MPLELERRRQFVDAFIEQFHHTVVGAVECDLADPYCARRFNPHTWVRRDDPGAAHPSKTFPHAFENSRAIVTPLVLIVVTDKIGRGIPVSVFDRVKEIFCVSPDLTLRPPEPDEIQPNTKCESQPAIESSTKRDRHGRDFILSRRLHHFKRRPSVRPRPERKRASGTSA